MTPKVHSTNFEAIPKSPARIIQKITQIEPANLSPGTRILYRSRRLTIVSIRRLKDEVHGALYLVECRDEGGARVSLTFAEGAKIEVWG